MYLKCDHVDPKLIPKHYKKKNSHMILRTTDTKKIDKLSE